MNSSELESCARARRRDIVRMDYEASSGHMGGSLSCMDILVALYFSAMDICPQNFSAFSRDRFVLSKGHCAEALYAVLAAKGFLNAEELMQYEKPFGRLYGHPTRKVPGVEVNTGALGHGLPIAVGMALAQRMDCIDKRVFVLLGDGEMAEGSNWEAIMAAGHYGLGNLVAIVDRNGLQISGTTEQVMAHGDLCTRVAGFGWSVLSVDGHDMSQLVGAFSKVQANGRKPLFICANTIKGKGVSFAENQPQWHHGVMNAEQYALAMAELGEAEHD
jgi:transketolase